MAQPHRLRVQTQRPPPLVKKTHSTTTTKQTRFVHRHFLILGDLLFKWCPCVQSSNEEQAPLKITRQSSRSDEPLGVNTQNQKC
ncbi:unnamed protein product [Didymodactylos carnosus]|uniref:Uncharacterized protein n=1 Tax=Didymodactylos carnosus TaxID=1234261 RepID=A0A814DQK5_9BILA|nr:unnamed protein product [Didymodactylos carnosus]CAF1460020.1 unnamed protein product [Didymodactylos carnosus]CAF3733058.1 unnamed protein product [Didymodactylos carnosus]CAF4253454.1 unnamed protein product [Didymodactylos carnosus]